MTPAETGNDTAPVAQVMTAKGHDADHALTGNGEVRELRHQTDDAESSDGKDKAVSLKEAGRGLSVSGHSRFPIGACRRRAP